MICSENPFGRGSADPRGEPFLEHEHFPRPLLDRSLAKKNQSRIVKFGRLARLMIPKPLDNDPQDKEQADTKKNQAVSSYPLLVAQRTKALDTARSQIV